MDQAAGKRHFRTLLLLVLFLMSEVSLSNGDTYRGAVYEHPVEQWDVGETEVTRETYLPLIMKNLLEYKKQTLLAAKQRVDILVFPEDGICGADGHTLDRRTMAPCLEYVPDPQEEEWTPCDDPHRYQDSDIQIFLSCLAKNNSIYIVANMGDKKPCNETDPYCPADGQYQFNTNVVYDKEGKLVARYHKRNLFYEYYYDTSRKIEEIYFDTPFGRFAVFTCFDILYRDPAITVIERYNVTNIVFPTAWNDELPLLGALQYHAAFAYGMGVNFLAANLHIPTDYYHGSGIFSPTSDPVFYYNDVTEEGRLLVADLEILPERRPTMRDNEDQLLQVNQPLSEGFVSDSYGDKFHFLTLSSNAGNLTHCHNDLCCHLEYEKNATIDLFALGVFDGLHTFEGNYYIQVCTVLRCAGSEWQTCGNATTLSSTNFNSFTLTGNFTGPYVVPEVLVSQNASLRLPKNSQWTAEGGTLTGTGFDHPLLSAALYGRVYSRDNMTLHDTNETNSLAVCCSILIAALLTCVVFY